MLVWYIYIVAWRDGRCMNERVNPYITMILLRKRPIGSVQKEHGISHVMFFRL